MKLKDLATVCKLLSDAGHGDVFVCAEHDQIYLVPPGVIEESSELGEKLSNLKVYYNDDEGWYVFV
jgi:hypothetical protein